jgi:hypothetical protein
MPALTETRPTTTRPLLSIARLNAADTLVRKEPFPFFVAHNQLPTDAAAALDQDFPRYREAGFFPHDPAECGPSFNALIEELTSPAFADAVGQRLGVPDLGSYPTLVTVSRSLNKTHGKIHTDGSSKIVTALMYLNRDWPNTSGGCLRFLKTIDDINGLVAPEVRPIYGTFAAFRRTDNSYHGHLPHEGERRVIQVAWLVSEEAKARKSRRGKISRIVKWATGLFSGPHFSTSQPRGKDD